MLGTCSSKGCVSVSFSFFTTLRLASRWLSSQERGWREKIEQIVTVEMGGFGMACQILACQVEIDRIEVVTKKQPDGSPSGGR